MTDHKIRKATRADLSAIAQIQVQSWQERYPGLMPQEIIDKNTVEDRLAMWTNVVDLAGHHLWVAAENETIVAFVSAGKHRESDDAGEVYALYALQEFHGKGFGRRLFEKAVQCLKNDGYTEVFLTVLDKNPTIDFYRHLGGIIVAPTEMKIDGFVIKEWIMRFAI